MNDDASILKPTGPYRQGSGIDALYAAHGEASFGNPPWADAAARFLIVRLSPWRDVERSTPHEFLFRELRAAMPDAYIDFSFFPTARDRAMFAEMGIPLMHGIASAKGAAGFDVIMASNAYTLELVNLAPFLSASGLPPSRVRRDASTARYPIVVLGGSNALASAAIYDEVSGDSLVDAVYFGEGEGAVGSMAASLSGASKLRGAERLEALQRIAGDTPGFWPTASRIPVTQAKAGADAYPIGSPPHLAGEESGTARLEITRGCPSFCTFCFEGWERKPYRERPLAAIVAEARRLKADTGADTVELASYNFNAHSKVADVIKELNKLFSVVSFQSQRVDILARVPALLRFEVAAGKRSFTVGIEGISARARAYFDKELSTAQIRSVMSRLIDEGAREIKLFYILSGLENGDDIAEFSGFVSWLTVAVSDSRTGAKPRIVFSTGELIRMPFTPLSYERLILEEGPYAAISGPLKATVEAAGFEYRAPEHFDEYCLSQVLALAPRGSYGLLQSMAEHGYVYDKNLTRGAWTFARGYLTERGALDGAFTGEKPRDYPFPYPFVATSASRDAVYGRFLDAKAGKQRASCLGSRCEACGACDDGERSFIAEHSLCTVLERDIKEIEAIVAVKRKPYESFVVAPLRSECATAHPAYAAALFLRGLYAALPGLVDTVLKAEDVFLQAKDSLERLPGAYGDTVYRVSSMRPLDASAIAGAGYTVIDAAPVPERLSLELRLGGIDIEAAAALLSGFMAAGAMTHTLRKSGEGIQLAVSDKGKKKRNVLGASLVADGATNSAVAARSVVATLECGAKYDIGSLIAEAAKRKIAVELKVLRSA